MIQPANRVTEIQEYYFSRKLKEVAKLNAEGMDIISLAIGSPDMPPSKQTIDCVRWHSALMHMVISLLWAYLSCARQWRVSISDGTM